MQRAAQDAARKLCIGQACRGKGLVTIDAHKTVQLLLHAVGAREYGFHRGERADLLRADRASKTGG